jgi:50S ribosomal protein L16 3-hydroxylase
LLHKVSLSNEGGGIGPHTDDYDVFLIQMAGTRRWDIGKRTISNKEEFDGLIDELDVRILKFWNDEVTNDFVKSFSLEPGDMIYLPPRFAHCGTALSDGCMTLSVGLRAPSAKEMLTKMTEYVDNNAVDGAFLKRYTDVELLNNNDGFQSHNVNEITREIKDKAKNLLKDAILGLLDDDQFFDDFFW